MNTIDEIVDFNNRLKLLEQESPNEFGITTFSEIYINKNQLEIIANRFYEWSYSDLFKYYQGKIHGNLLLSQSIYTTREEQPDFQYIFDLGIQALEQGMELKK